MLYGSLFIYYTITSVLSCQRILYATKKENIKGAEGMEEKKIEQLCKLLKRAERGYDTESCTSLGNFHPRKVTSSSTGASLH